MGGRYIYIYVYTDLFATSNIRGIDRYILKRIG